MIDEYTRRGSIFATHIGEKEALFRKVLDNVIKIRLESGVSKILPKRLSISCVSY